MDKIEATTLLSDKNISIKKVKEIYSIFCGDSEIESSVAMNLSQKTSVYDRELGKSNEMVELLILLSNSSSMEARWAVAKNPHTPSNILEILSKDKVNLVRALVATNINTPTKILESFFNDEKIVRDGLSGNPNCSIEILGALARDSDKMVRLRVAENPSTSKETLEFLSKDLEKDVQLAALSKLKS